MHVLPNEPTQRILLIVSAVRRNSQVTISCVVSQLTGAWNDLWRSKERYHLNSKPFSEWLLAAERFGDYASWISYTDFRTQANATIDVVYMTPREAKNHHGRTLSGWRGIDRGICELTAQASTVLQGKRLRCPMDG